MRTIIIVNITLIIYIEPQRFLLLSWEDKASERSACQEQRNQDGEQGGPP